MIDRLNIRQYIDNNLPVEDLYDLGVISTVEDYNQIAKEVCEFLNMKSIFDYTNIPTWTHIKR